MRREYITAEPITLDANVWIGAAATVLPGVHIGEGAVVAAGAVVTHDVPPGTPVAGVPARFEGPSGLENRGAPSASRGLASQMSTLVDFNKR